MAQQAQEEQQKAQEEAQAKAVEDAEAEQKRKEEKRAKRQAERQSNDAIAKINGISNKQMKLMTLAMVLKLLSQDKVTTILNKFDSNDSLTISQYMNMADLESKLESDIIANCLKDIRDILPIKRKLTKENVILDMKDIYAVHSREKVEKILKNERPIVKRFVSQAYDGEYGDLPLHVAGVVTEYISENV